MRLEPLTPGECYASKDKELKTTQTEPSTAASLAKQEFPHFPPLSLEASYLHVKPTKQAQQGKDELAEVQKQIEEFSAASLAHSNSWLSTQSHHSLSL